MEMQNTLKHSEGIINLVGEPIAEKRWTEDQCKEIAKNTLAIRSLDWDRSRFDIEFGLRNGTTYNSFIIEGEITALIDSSHEKFRDIWLEILLKKLIPTNLIF